MAVQSMHEDNVYIGYSWLEHLGQIISFDMEIRCALQPVNGHDHEGRTDFGIQRTLEAILQKAELL